MAREEGYNGYTNYETWAVKLWIDNDQGSQEYWLEQARDWLNTPPSASGVGQPRFGTYRLADQLEDEHKEAAEGEVVSGTVFSDLMTAALSSVNWYEIAEHLIEDAKEVS